jgi:hypothetical protein
MISKQDREHILSFVRKVVPTVLEEINFDPSVKEVGQAFANRFEDCLVGKFVDFDNQFTRAKKNRSSDDVKYKDNFINIKFGYKKNGQPNICSMHRLFKYFHEGAIDSYYLLTVDAHGPEIELFDVVDYLDCTNFNYGTGQFMLSERKFKKVYVPNQKARLSKEEKICKIGKMMKIELNRHIELKQKQQQKIDEIVAEYEKSL